MSTWWLFLDDNRLPFWDDFPEWADNKSLVVVIRSGEEAIKEIESRGLPERMAVDGDLGWGMSGMQFLIWLKRNHRDYGGRIECHSGDHWGRKAMREFVTDVFPNTTDSVCKVLTPES